MKLLAAVGSIGLLASAAFAQNAQGQTKRDIWQPHEHIKEQNITLMPWGSGSIAETDETAYDGAFSLRVSTHNYFQGGFVKFNSPIDLSSTSSDPNNLLALTFRTAESLVIAAQPGANAQGAGGGEGELGGRGGGLRNPGAPGAPGSPGAPGQVTPNGGRGGKGGGGGEGFGGGGGLQNPGGAAATTVPDTLKTIRVVITTTDGKKSETYLPLPTAQPGKSWRSVAIPLQAINGFSKTNRIIESMGFSGDTTSTYYIGDIRVVNDPTPIAGEIRSPREDLNLALGDTVRFSASGYGGATILKYTWDFDAEDGIQEDAVGQVVEHRFRKPGKFVVTLVIKDFYGLKAPFSAKVNVTVNP